MRASLIAVLTVMALLMTASPGPMAQQNAAPPEPTDAPEDLPAGRGRDEMFYSCTPCHGLAIIRQQGMSRERWAATYEEMRSRHNMPELPDADLALVLDYLAQHFPSRSRAPVNPFLRR